MSSPIKLREITTASSSTGPSRVCERWSDLCPDLLVSIFCRLSSVDLITGVSSVCSSWRVAVMNPRCWRIVDLSDWDFSSRAVLGSLNTVLDRVLKFSCDAACIEEVYLPGVAHWRDLVIAGRIPNFLYLSFPSLSKPGKQDYAAVANFESLDGSKVTPYLLILEKTFTLSSTHLTTLSELKVLLWTRSTVVDLRITTIICAKFPKLRKLEMLWIRINTEAVLMLLDSLKHLEYLDVEYDVSGATKEVLEKTRRLKVFNCH